ncbi:zinc finger protein, partial (macronuclear) [Tetrahymena thermophila SB210]
MVEGCAKCDFNQICLECNQNLMLDTKSNICYLKQDTCSSKFDFIQQPFKLNQCVQSCPSPFYQNQMTQICEKNLQCLQFDRISAQLNQRVTQIEQFQQNSYLIRSNQCNFAVADQNFQIIYTQVLQNMTNFEELYMPTPGQEFYQKSFIIGQYGGCTANNTLIVMDFIKNRIVFQQINLDQDYHFLYADTFNQI